MKAHALEVTVRSQRAPSERQPAHPVLRKRVVAVGRDRAHPNQLSPSVQPVRHARALALDRHGTGIDQPIDQEQRTDRRTHGIVPRHTRAEHVQHRLMCADGFGVRPRPRIRFDAVAANLERTAHPLVRRGGGTGIVDAEPRREFGNRRVRRIAQAPQFAFSAEKAQHVPRLHQRFTRPGCPPVRLRHGGLLRRPAVEQLLQP